MEDEAIQAHIGEEAQKVAQLTAEHHSSRDAKMPIEFSLSSQKRQSKALKDQTLPKSTDVDSFWSLMENKTIHAHLKAEAYKMIELVSRDHGGCGTSAKYIPKNMGVDQTTRTPKTNQRIPKASVKDDFWSIMENETSHAHLKEEAHKVADLIARHWGTANRLPQL
ncbi:TOG array regulator of axonemal microtubules protein 2-like protein [Lates japonicus]|uniref:TOG array regulator of axonemal microtubules protein 2-like protein n=1 Tax=Lates japonicus TaxID=270547 RepID=A0AAD3MVS2_LATJO|nr:TOG array regulator of axonemal microtubules protein 2-like protein [Lates japonicus]